MHRPSFQACCCRAKATAADFACNHIVIDESTHAVEAYGALQLIPNCGFHTSMKLADRLGLCLPDVECLANGGLVLPVLVASRKGSKSSELISKPLERRLAPATRTLPRCALETVSFRCIADISFVDMMRFVFGALCCAWSERFVRCVGLWPAGILQGRC